MPVRLFSQPTSIIYPILVGGYVYVEDIFGFGFFPIADIVNADIVSAFGEPPVQWLAGGIVTPLFQVTEFNPEAISTFTGNPTKAKFGQIGLVDRGAAVDWEFVYNPLQRFKTRKILLRPEPTSYPLDPAEVGPAVNRDWIPNLFIVLSPRVLFPPELSSTVDNIGYDLQLTVQGRFIVEYVCGFRDPGDYGTEVFGIYPY